MDPTSAFARRHELKLLDVREPSEWQAGHIEGSQHIPMRELPMHLEDLKDDGTLVAVCRTGSRSAHVTQYLRSNGFDVVNLVGGLKAWAKAGLPIVNPSGGPGRVV